MKKYWAKTRRKASRANSQPCISMFDVEMFFGFPTHFSFVDWNILLSFGLLPQSVCKSSHHPGISNILESPIQSRIFFSQLHAMVSLEHQAGVLLTHTTSLSSFHQPQREIPQKLPSSSACQGWNMARSFKYNFINFLFLMISFSDKHFSLTPFHMLEANLGALK